MANYITHAERETEELGCRLAKSLPGGSVVAMYGDLGAGKTAFVRGMARGLGLSCRVSSPTFTIVNEYIGERELIHFDMYRLSGAETAVHGNDGSVGQDPRQAAAQFLRLRFAVGSKDRHDAPLNE